MSKIDACRYILRIWMDRDRGADDFNASAVMVYLVMLGFPCTRSGVLSIARAYCDNETENPIIYVTYHDGQS